MSLTKTFNKYRVEWFSIPMCTVLDSSSNPDDVRYSLINDSNYDENIKVYMIA